MSEQLSRLSLSPNRFYFYLVLRKGFEPSHHFILSKVGFSNFLISAFNNFFKIFNRHISIHLTELFFSLNTFIVLPNIPTPSESKSTEFIKLSHACFLISIVTFIKLLISTTGGIQTHTSLVPKTSRLCQFPHCGLFCTGGGIRTHGKMILSHLCFANFITPAI